MYYEDIPPKLVVFLSSKDPRRRPSFWHPGELPPRQKLPFLENLELIPRAFRAPHAMRHAPDFRWSRSCEEVLAFSPTANGAHSNTIQGWNMQFARLAGRGATRIVQAACRQIPSQRNYNKILESRMAIFLTEPVFGSFFQHGHFALGGGRICLALCNPYLFNRMLKKQS